MMRPRPLARRCGRQRPTRRTCGTSRSSTAAVTGSGVTSGRGAGRRAAAVQHEDVDPAERLDGRRRRGARDRRAAVRSPGTASAPIRAASRSTTSRAAREHRHVRALGGERLGDREPHALRGAEHDRAPSVKAEIHRPGSVPGRTVQDVQSRRLSSRRPCAGAQTSLQHADDLATAAAEALSIRFSSAESCSFTISSTPPAPSLTGTPM